MIKHVIYCINYRHIDILKSYAILVCSLHEAYVATYGMYSTVFSAAELKLAR